MASATLTLYGSRTYKSLLYAKMRGNRRFYSSDIKECLPGLFKGHDLRDAREALGSMSKRGFINRISPDYWEITPAGIEQIYHSAAFYRVSCRRNLGPQFMAAHYDKLAKVADKATFLSPDYLDEEDLILEELLAKVEARAERKRISSARRKAHRSAD
jgi:hypothetical protein